MRGTSAPESSDEAEPSYILISKQNVCTFIYFVLKTKFLYLRARFFLLIGSVRSLSGVFGKTLGGMIETLEGVGEGGEQEGEEERKSSTSPLKMT